MLRRVTSKPEIVSFPDNKSRSNSALPSIQHPWWLPTQKDQWLQLSNKKRFYHKLKFPPSTSIQDIESLPEVIWDSQAASDTGMSQAAHDNDAKHTKQVQLTTPKKR